MSAGPVWLLEHVRCEAAQWIEAGHGIVSILYLIERSTGGCMRAAALLFHAHSTGWFGLASRSIFIIRMFCKLKKKKQTKS